jgi:serine/threonine protein kinase/Tfp pilus assembly protein PilF
MRPEEWERCVEIFSAALDRQSEQRAAFVEQVCGGNESLRREVTLLLRSHEESGDFISAPVFVSAPELRTDDDQDTLVGTHIGPYRIESVLGSGGMGVVYLALDERLGRKVGLKLLPQSLAADVRHLGRLKREARTASALNHPNIVTIHEIGEADSISYIASELIDGETLRQRLARGRIALNEALNIAAQVAGALTAAHEAGIVHRDIKPENIMLRPDGYVKVLDFGIAKLAESTLAEAITDGVQSIAITDTGFGSVLGTVCYMSPEQARGAKVDSATDIWSLGVVLYEMVTGHVPFNRETSVEVVSAIFENEPPPLAMHPANTPAELQRIVNKTLRKNREQRHNAQELLNALQALRRKLEFEAELKRSTAAVPWLHWARSRAAVVLGLLTAVFALALPLYRHRNLATSLPVYKSIAVLPLENLDPSQDYFANGMTEGLISDLAKVSALRVMSRASVVQYQHTKKPPRDIGRELKVDALLTGSVAREGDRARVALQLIHAATGQNLWSANYERDLRDLVALQKEVARSVVSQIRVAVTPQEQLQLGYARPVNPEAYDDYLRGQFYFHRQTRESNAAAITAFERAVASDPGFAAAHAALAQAYVWRFFLFSPNERKWAENAFVEVEKALALDPNLGLAHLARGRLLWTPANRFPHEKAIREYRHALELDPSLDEARNQLALVYCHVGLFDEALLELRHAVAINPSNNLAQFRLGETLLFKGEYEEALPALRGVPPEVNPSLIGNQIAMTLLHLDRKKEAAATLDRFLRNFPEDNRGLFTSVQAIIAALEGDAQLAQEKITAAIDQGAGFGHFHHTAYHIACSYALMNRRDEALKWLENAADDGFPCYPMFEHDSMLDNLRQDRRFNALLSKLRGEWENYRLKLF